jgi:hypothetical protein
MRRQRTSETHHSGGKRAPLSLQTYPSRAKFPLKAKIIKELLMMLTKKIGQP